MARLTFSNVPTKSGGVVSGNISTGAGSPFGKGGKYEAQVADIESIISQAPKGFYDPVGWDAFLQKEEEAPDFLVGQQYYHADDPAIMEELLLIPSARNAMIELGNLPLGSFKGTNNPRHSLAQANVILAKKKMYEKEIALHVNHLMSEYNAPFIEAVEKHERQLEIDKAVQLALEQKVRETAKPEPTPTPEPEPTPTAPEIITSTTSYLPLAVVGIVIVVILLFLRRRA